MNVAPSTSTSIVRKSTEQVAGVPTAQDELRGEDVTVLHGAEDLHAQTVQGVEHLTVEGAQTIEVRHVLRVAVRDDGRRVGRLPSGDSCRRQGRDRRVAIAMTEDAAGLACVAASGPRPGARTGQRCPRLRRPRLLSRACCASPTRLLAHQRRGVQVSAHAELRMSVVRDGS